MEWDLMKIVFASMTLVIVVVGGLVNWKESDLPQFIVQSFRYGKHSSKSNVRMFLKPIHVPKRWFRHFYLFATSYSSFILIVASNVYFLKSSLEPWMITMLDFLGSSKRSANVSVPSTMIALTLMTIQCWHRFYETWFVSVYSHSKMNLSHYLVGFIHYFGAITAIIVEAPGFVRNSGDTLNFNWREIAFLDVVGTVGFLFACYKQYTYAVILANLRKGGKAGEVSSQKHSLPRGALFDSVSSPHLLAEICMYVFMLAVLRESTTWPYVVAWVAANQVENALLTHWWYKEKFRNYPKNRKAIIPHIL